jgi:hypothetical protein
MTVSSGAGNSTDTAEIYAVPPTPMVALDTEVQVGEGDRAQPAIRVGSNLLPAPYMSSTSGNYSGGAHGGFEYTALWQVVALERATTALKWNRTYGICWTHEGGDYTCRNGENDAAGESQTGDPVAANLKCAQQRDAGDRRLPQEQDPRRTCLASAIRV